MIYSKRQNPAKQMGRHISINREARIEKTNEVDEGILFPKNPGKGLEFPFLSLLLGTQYGIS
jgi:hypothetical protein